MNRLSEIIHNPNINFKAVGLDNFNHKMLMNDKSVDINTKKAEKIIDIYTTLDLRKYFMTKRSVKEEDRTESDGRLIYLYHKIRRELSALDNNINYVVDVLVEYLYNYKKSSFKTTLWESFGDVIVENLRFNVAVNQIYCEVCGDIIEQSRNFGRKYCDECGVSRRRVYQKKLMQNRRNL